MIYFYILTKMKKRNIDIKGNTKIVFPFNVQGRDIMWI